MPGLVRLRFHRYPWPDHGCSLLPGRIVPPRSSPPAPKPRSKRETLARGAFIDLVRAKSEPCCTSVPWLADPVAPHAPCGWRLLFLRDACPCLPNYTPYTLHGKSAESPRGAVLDTNLLIISSGKGWQSSHQRGGTTTRSISLRVATAREWACVLLTRNAKRIEPIRGYPLMTT